MHHGVEITDPAIVAAATLSHRYIADRQLPDKAIDLMDEAASRIRMEIDSKPEEMDRKERRLIQLKIQREALKKEKDANRSSAWPTWRPRSTRWSASSPTSRKSGRPRRPRCSGATQDQGADRAGASLELEAAQRAQDYRRDERDPVRPPAGTGEAAAGRAGSRDARASPCCRTRSPPRRSPKSCRAGPASRSARCSRASARSC